MRLVSIAALFLFMAGCASPGPLSDDTPPTAPPTRNAEATFWSDCEQWHLHFDARAEDFEADAPPGYTVTADATGLTTLLIHVTLCLDIQEAYLAVPVTPPSEHDDPDRSELATIQIFHAGHGPGLYPESFHRRLVEASFDLSDAPSGPSLTVNGGGETFTVTNLLSPSSGSFAGEHWARIAYDNGTYGILNADGNESTNMGSGPVTYTHEGPGGAPPATAGIAHVVTGLDIHMTKETRQ